MPRAYAHAMRCMRMESPSATRAHARRCASVRDLPHPHPWPEQGCQIRSRSFEGGYNTRKMYLRGSFRVQASHGAQVLRVCAPCLAVYEHAALPHTGLSGSLHRQDLPPRAYQGAEVFFVRLLNARMSRAVGHVGDPPALSFTWKFSTTTMPRLTWGIVDQFASAQSPRIH